MVGHEDPGMYFNAVFRCCFLKPASISSYVPVLIKDSLLVISPLDHVLGESRRAKSETSRHSNLSQLSVLRRSLTTLRQVGCRKEALLAAIK